MAQGRFRGPPRGGGRAQAPFCQSKLQSFAQVWVYRAVGNFYLKYSWEYFMRKNMHNIFLYCGQPEYFRQFLISVVCWAGPTGRELPITYSHFWGSHNTLGKKYALHIQDIQAPPIYHVCDNFRPHGTLRNGKGECLSPWNQKKHLWGNYGSSGQS